MYCTVILCTGIFSKCSFLKQLKYFTQSIRFSGICPLDAAREYWMIYMLSRPSFHFSPSLPPPPPSCQQVVSFSQTSCVSPVNLTGGREGKGWGRSKFIRGRYSLVLYESFNTLWKQRFSSKRVCLVGMGILSVPQLPTNGQFRIGIREQARAHI